jgi:hypothetical protein
MVISLYFLFEHDLFGKPRHTFPDHALAGRRSEAPFRGFSYQPSWCSLPFAANLSVQEVTDNRASPTVKLSAIEFA